MELILPTPKDFGFDATVRGHGWYDLAPFRYEADGVLRMALALPAGAAGPRAAALRIDEPAPGTLRVRAAGAGEPDRPAIEGAVRSMLRLDQDLGPLHRALARAGPAYAWVRERGAGRLLRAPTAFEDAVKVLLTTNCSFAATRGRVRRLVLALGAPAPGGLRAFPDAARMAGAPAAFYRDHVRAGYRAEALRDLVRAVASGAVAIEAWRAPGRPADEVRGEALALRGFGPYAADQVLRLLGHFRFPALDSWMRGAWRRLHPRSKASGREILRRYAARFGDLSGLVLWLDLTREWHSPGGARAWP